IHNILLSEVDKMLHVDFHLEFEGDLPLSRAHEVATALESKIKALDPSISSASSHFEPVENITRTGKDDRVAEDYLAHSIEGLVNGYPEIKYKHVEVVKIDSRYRVSLCCIFAKAATVSDVHANASKIEAAIRLRHPEVESVSIHQEPLE
ncbi:MAG TPA: cation transporter dimerization domain-containing protein, partial [Candidatus Methanomethylicus sp.]|nr:cation transporter dimerization domain-containing protein [Candidatus Methanomethylicus sp.]